MTRASNKSAFCLGTSAGQYFSNNCLSPSLVSPSPRATSRRSSATRGTSHFLSCRMMLSSSSASTELSPRARSIDVRNSCCSVYSSARSISCHAWSTVPRSRPAFASSIRKPAGLCFLRKCFLSPASSPNRDLHAPQTKGKLSSSYASSSCCVSKDAPSAALKGFSRSLIVGGGPNTSSSSRFFAIWYSVSPADL